jgi:hypothetical protein
MERNLTLRFNVVQSMRSGRGVKWEFLRTDVGAPETADVANACLWAQQVEIRY